MPLTPKTFRQGGTEEEGNTTGTLRTTRTGHGRVRARGQAAHKAPWVWGYTRGRGVRPLHEPDREAVGGR